MAKWGEIKCPRCAELEAQIAAMEEGLTAVHMAGYMEGKKAAEAKLAQQDDLVQAANRLAEYLNGDHIYMERVHHLVAAIRKGGESNACVSCGAPTPNDFCGFCLEEE